MSLPALQAVWVGILLRQKSFHISKQGSITHSLSQCQKLTFLWIASTFYLLFKVVAKLTYLVAIIGGHVTALLSPIVRFMTKQNSIWSKALIMPLTIWNCILSYKHNFAVKISLLFQKNTSITEFPGSNCLLPTCLTDGKWDF